jgi:hypothetical protein
MPNCDFYALQEDGLAVLDFVLTQTESQVYESYSNPGTELRRFNSVGELALAFRPGVGGPSLLLSLYDPQMGGTVSIRRIELTPEEFSATPWRFTAEGWGLIQLSLRGLHEGQIFPSHTNHNTEKRALAWQSTHPELGEPASWNWRVVTSLSRRINRFVHRLAPHNSGSRPVLPAAAACVRSGQALLARSAA